MNGVLEVIGEGSLVKLIEFFLFETYFLLGEEFLLSVLKQGAHYVRKYFDVACEWSQLGVKFS